MAKSQNVTVYYLKILEIVTILLDKTGRGSKRAIFHFKNFMETVLTLRILRFMMCIETIRRLEKTLPALWETFPMSFDEFKTSSALP